MSIPDSRPVGRSKLVPFVSGEDPGKRHDRRLNANLSRQDEVRAWCASAGVTFKISNDGHHWRFKRQNRVAEWWPWSAKLVIQKKYDHGIHVHDHLQALHQLKKQFPGGPKVATPPAKGPTKIYVASSWRNEMQPGVVQALRAAGHEVYDFRNPHQTGGDRGRRGVGFSWSEISPEWQSWTPSQYANALEHPAARDGFGSDMDALRWCDWCVMVQPCGRSSALELGWAVGAGKLTAVLLHDDEASAKAKGHTWDSDRCCHACGDMDGCHRPRTFEPELMLRMATHLVASMEDLLACLRVPAEVRS